MKVLLTAVLAAFSIASIAQIVSPDCNSAQNICSQNGTTFPLNNPNTPGNPNPAQGFPDIPAGSNISNPTSNPQGVNSGCLLAGELNPNWFVINVGSSGNLVFTVGQAGGSGFYDWALWPYNPNTTCTGITGNTLAPVSCNWNASSAGFTGMWNGGTPPGGNPGNFQPSIPVVAGQAYILCFTNYSFQTGNVNLSFPTTPGSAGITCSPGTPDANICLGQSTNVTIVVPPTVTNPTFNWLVTTGVSNPTGGTNVTVTPTVTTQYVVQIFDPVLTGGVVNDTFTIYVEQPPNPNAGIDQQLCLGDQILMAGVPNPVGPVHWAYNASGVTPTPTVTSPNWNIPNSVVNVNQPGTYMFFMQQTGTLCPMVQDTMIVTVDDLQISATTVSPTCQGFTDGQITITAPGAVEYSFDNGVNWIASNTMNTFRAGTYTVCARTALGCDKCTTVNIVDPAPMTISVSNDTTVCENGTATLSASATGGTSYSFHWSHTTDLGAVQVVNPISSGSYTVYAENQTGCVSPNATINVTVLPGLSGTISAWDTICPGYPTDLSATVNGGNGGPYTFTWTSGDVYTGNGQHTINVNPPVTTTYTVTIEDGCETTPLVLSTNVRVAPLPVPMVTVLNPDQCEPAVFDIVNITDPALSQYTYWVVNGEDQYINQDTITTVPLYADGQDVGYYDVQLIVTSFEGCIDSVTFTDLLEVKPKPVADFRYSPNPVLMFNTQVHFTNYSFNGYTYQWFFEDGFPSQSTQTNVDVFFPDGVTGRYDVMLITTSELGCVDTLTHELIVFPEVLIYAPNTFTPDGDEHNQAWRIYMEGIDVYDFELLIFDRWGELIWESHDIEVPWDGTYNGQSVPAGTYTWIVRTKDILNDDKYTYNGHVNILK